MGTSLIIFPYGHQGASNLVCDFNECGRILDWFSRLWYIDTIWWHSTPGLFLSRPLTKYFDSFVDLSKQRILLGLQNPCWPAVLHVNSITLLSSDLRTLYSGHLENCVFTCLGPQCELYIFDVTLTISLLLGLALLTLSWDKNWDSHSLVNGYPSFYPRIALVAPSPDRQN